MFSYFSRFLRICLAYLLCLSESALAEKVMNITDPSILDQLSDTNFAFRAQFDSQGSNAEALFQSSMYRSLVDQIAVELIQQEETVKQYVSKPAFIDRFKIDWLRSSRLTFQLSAIINRFDRRNLDDSPCGEVRLIYRPKYKSVLKEVPFERLPMTVMLVFSALDAMKGSKCVDVAKEMLMPSNLSSKNFLNYYLHKNKLGSSFYRKRLSFSRLEVNIQISQWPANKYDGFSDQAHYLMRVFVPNESRTSLIPAPLENTPDVGRLLGSPLELSELRHFLLNPSNMALASIGTLQIPKRFLAMSEVSVSPLGMARLVNRPFSALFKSEEEFGSAYLRQLDSLSCMGCHQGKSIAGFHVLGFDTAMQNKELTLISPFSANFEVIQTWRLQDVKAAMKGIESSPFPSPERGGNGSVGDTCSMDRSTLDWGCQIGLKCDVEYSGEADIRFGQCVSVNPEIVGSPCDTVHIGSKVFPLNDQYVNSSIKACGEVSVCAPSTAGFPNGFCAKKCKPSGINLCTPVPSLGPFSECLKLTSEFRSCARQFNIVVDMPRCSTNMDCRRDYACIKASGSQGFCAPPYFVPELTLGHHKL